MQDNFNVHAWKLKRALKEKTECGYKQDGIKEERTYDSMVYIDKMYKMLDNLIKNTSSNLNIPRHDKSGLIDSFEVLQEQLEYLREELEGNEDKNPFTSGDKLNYTKHDGSSLRYRDDGGTDGG